MGRQLWSNRPTQRLFTFRNMILGLRMASLLGSGPAGIPTRDFFLRALGLDLVLALESASLADLAGDGTTGATTGSTTTFVLTTAITSPTVESSSTATTSIMRVDFMAERPGEDLAEPHMALLGITRLVCTLARSAALVTEVSQGRIPSADGRASAEVFMVAAFTVAEASTPGEATGNSGSSRSHKLLSNTFIRRTRLCCTLQIGN